MPRQILASAAPILLFLLLPFPAAAQPQDAPGARTAGAAGAAPNERILQALARDECTVAAEGVRICHADYSVDGRPVEAISFRPAGEARTPGALLIPGFDRTARDLIGLGARLAAQGIAALAVSQPGFGNSAGPPDYVGPQTLKVLTAGYRKLQADPRVDPARVGIYGYSRGGMAASLLAVKLPDVKAAVFGAGVYDFKREYDEVTLEGIRKNMMAETGMNAAAIRERSSILEMEKLRCPVLILHGGRDVNVPVSQALTLRDRLSALGKEFEIKIFPDREHGIGPEVATLTLDFFRRKL